MRINPKFVIGIIFLIIANTVSLDVQHSDKCEHSTMGENCEKCISGFWGDPINGVKCRPCECNGEATECDQNTGKCFCITKGLIGDKCDTCDSTNRYSRDDSIDGLCYYNLWTDYRFTFNFSRISDRHYTKINFKNSPGKKDVDVDFKVNCSASAKVNVTILTSNGKENIIFQSIDCKDTHHIFSKNEYDFRIVEDVALTSFFVSVYDFKTPLVVDIIFEQRRALFWKLFGLE